MTAVITTAPRLTRKSSHLMVLDILRYNTMSRCFANMSDSAIIKTYNAMVGLSGKFLCGLNSGEAVYVDMYS